MANNIFNITNSGSGAYLIDGVSNDTITVVRGETYTFNISASGHPFWIQTVPSPYSSSDVYNVGITNNGTDNGTLTWVVDSQAPSTLYYACQFHSSMGGTINVVDELTTTTTTEEPTTTTEEPTTTTEEPTTTTEEPTTTTTTAPPSVVIALEFPLNPTVNQEYSVGALTWRWDGARWKVVRTFSPSDSAAIAATLNSFLDGLNQTQSEVEQTILDTVTNVEGTVNTALQSIDTTTSSTISSVNSTVDAALTSITTTATDAVDTITNTETSAVTTISNAVTTATNEVSTTVANALASIQNNLEFRGTLGASGQTTELPTTYEVGWMYKIVDEGIIAGQRVEVGDMIIAMVNREGTGNLDEDWVVTQGNIDTALSEAIAIAYAVAL